MESKKFISLIDANFAGRDVINMPGVNFSWCVENKLISNHVFFTDYKLDVVDKIKHENVKKVAWLIEPRAICSDSYNYVERNYYKFDYVISFDDQICKLPNALFSPFGSFWVDKKTPTKTKKVSMIASNKGWTNGHKLRLNIVSNVSGIDYFGSCCNNYIKTKNFGLDDYRFSVAIENSIQDCYFTEKLLDCFATKTVPIYWGAKSISKFFNTDGVIFFETKEELQSILQSLTEEKYESMLDAVNENFLKVDRFYIPEMYIQDNYNFLLN